VRNSQATLRFFEGDKDPFENIKMYLRFSLFFLQARTSIKLLFTIAKVCFNYLGQIWKRSLKPPNYESLQKKFFRHFLYI
jgi:hypothetical protein